MVAHIRCRVYSLTTDRLTELCVRLPRDACTMDNIHACTDEEIYWSQRLCIEGRELGFN